MSTDDQNAPNLAEWVEQVLDVEVTPWQRHVLDHIPYERASVEAVGRLPANETVISLARRKVEDMGQPDELAEAERARAIAHMSLRHWANGITTNPPSPEECGAVLAELERLRSQLAEANEMGTRIMSALHGIRRQLRILDEHAGWAELIPAKVDRLVAIEQRAREMRGASHERSSLVAGYILTGER